MARVDMTTHRRPIWKKPLLLLLLLALGLAGTAAFQSAWRWGCKMASANGLQQIKLALENYRQANGCYPPQYLADKNRTPDAQLAHPDLAVPGRRRVLPALPL